MARLKILRHHVSYPPASLIGLGDTIIEHCSGEALGIAGVTNRRYVHSLSSPLTMLEGSTTRKE